MINTIILASIAIGAVLLSKAITPKKPYRHNLTSNWPTTRKQKYKNDPSENWPFEKTQILSMAEQPVYNKLKQALPEHHIFSQVQLSQIIKVKKGYNVQAWFNRINRMSADFVITKSNFQMVAVIELDDSSHNRIDRQKADQKKDKALKSAGINIVRWKIGQVPDKETIKQLFTDPEQKPEECPQYRPQFDI